MALLVLGLVGLAIGVWLGLPGRYEQTPDDIERLMAQGGRSRQRRPKRSLSPVAWLQRKLSPGRTPPSRRKGFRLEAPGERKESPARAAPARVSRPAREPDIEAASPPPKRTRATLRDGRFKLRPPGEAGGG